MRSSTARGAHGRAASTARRLREGFSQAKAGIPTGTVGPTAAFTGDAVTPTTARADPTGPAGAVASPTVPIKGVLGRTKALVVKAREATPSFTPAAGRGALRFPTSAGASSPEGFCTSVDRPRMAPAQAVAASVLAAGRPAGKAVRPDGDVVARPISSTAPSSRA